MIEESYVSLETAKLLEEAGFDDIPCEWSYNDDGKISVTYTTNGTLPKGHVARPTQALAARWLREKYRFHVYCLQTNLPLTEPQTDKWEWGYIIAKIDDPNGGSVLDMNFPNYEAALEAGIVKCLELLRF